MKSAGKALWMIGVGVMAYAFFVFDTSVEALGSDRVVNLDLQQRQLMMMIVGGLMVLVGAILHAIGIVRPIAPQVAPAPATIQPPAAKVDLAAELARQRAALDASLARRDGIQK